MVITKNHSSFLLFIVSFHHFHKSMHYSPKKQQYVQTLYHERLNIYASSVDIQSSFPKRKKDTNNHLSASVWLGSGKTLESEFGRSRPCPFRVQDMLRPNYC